MLNFRRQLASLHEHTVPPGGHRRTLETRVFRATAVVLATLAGAYVLWLLVDLLLLLFACILVSLILLTLADALGGPLRLPFALSLTVAVLLLLGLVGGAILFFGTTIQYEFLELALRLPAAWERLEAQLAASPVGASMIDQARSFAPTGQTVVNVVTTTLAAIGGALSGLVIVLVGGLYLAAQPKLYGVGLLRLFPPRVRAATADTLDAIVVSLQNWLKGQALGMLFVGVGTGFGLWLLGVPAAWAIGLVAGLAEFVPYAGILFAGIPALVLGFGQSTATGLWTLGVLVAVQQVQGNLVMPLLQRHMVDLPPAITIFGIIAAGILFGVAGVLLATPLTIVVLVLVRRLYLGEDEEEILASGADETPG